MPNKNSATPIVAVVSVPPRIVCPPYGGCLLANLPPPVELWVGPFSTSLTKLNWPYTLSVLFLVQRFVTISARRATVWDGKTGEALTTLTSKRLLGNEEADITAFCLDHQVCRRYNVCHYMVGTRAAGYSYMFANCVRWSISGS